MVAEASVRFTRRIAELVPAQPLQATETVCEK
jgi:hypothetical protein